MNSGNRVVLVTPKFDQKIKRREKEHEKDSIKKSSEGIKNMKRIRSKNQAKGERT